jgi:hypothetical protein
MRHRLPRQIGTRVIWFSLPIFDHVHQRRHLEQATIGTRGRAVIHEHLQKLLADLIAGDIRKAFQNRLKTSEQIPSDLVVQYVASTFILVLNWWVENRNPLAPKGAHDLFRALVLPTLTAALG